MQLSLPKPFPLLYFGFLCLQVSSVSNFLPDTRGQKWPFIHVHSFSCAVEREGHCKKKKKYPWHVWGVHTVDGPHGVFHRARQHILPRSTLLLLMACVLSQSILLRLQVALQGNCLKRALGCVHFPGLLGYSTKARLGWVGLVLCPSRVRAAQATKYLASTLSPGGPCILSSPPSQPLGFLGASRSAISGVPCVSSGELISSCDPPGRCQLSRIPGRLG